MVFLLIFSIIILLILFSKIEIKIINLKINSKAKKHISPDYKIVIKLIILKKIPISKINITKTKLEKLEIKNQIKKIDLKILKNKNKFEIKLLNIIKELKIKVKYINLKITIGTENAALTAILIPIISTIISNIFRKVIKEYERQTFIVNPLYINQNLINIETTSIFEIKLIHIINIIYILTKKEGVKKNERTSNRRTYGYSYE